MPYKVEFTLRTFKCPQGCCRGVQHHRPLPRPMMPRMVGRKAHFLMPYHHFLSDHDPHVLRTMIGFKKTGGAHRRTLPQSVSTIFVLCTVFPHINSFFHPPIGRNYPRRTQYTEHFLYSKRAAHRPPFFMSFFQKNCPVPAVGLLPFRLQPQPLFIVSNPSFDSLPAVLQPQLPDQGCQLVDGVAHGVTCGVDHAASLSHRMTPGYVCGIC